MTEEEMQFEFEQCETFSPNGNKKSGYLVETKKGIMGRTYNSEDFINGKTIVHTDKGKLLCDPKTVLIKGFID